MKKLLALVLSGLMIFSAAACSSGSSEKNTDGAEQTEGQGDTAELSDFDVVLDWYPNAVHSFIYVGIEKGYYAEEGLNVNVRFPSNANDAISLTAAGKADAGIYYQPSVIETAADQNVPVKVIGTIVQHPLDIVLFMNESGIKKPEDLVGKTVGCSGISADETFLTAMLESCGHSLADINLIDVGFDLNTALITGNVDATIGGYINHEYPTLKKEGYDEGYMNLTEGGVPDYEELILVTGEKQIEEEKDKLAAFVRASRRAFEDVKSDPEAALQILLSKQDEANYPLDEEVETASMEILLPLMYSDSQGFLEVNEDNWTNTIEWMKEKGLIENDITAQDILVDVTE